MKSVLAIAILLLPAVFAVSELFTPSGAPDDTYAVPNDYEPEDEYDYSYQSEYSDYDCSDFSYQENAQDFYESEGGPDEDYHDLDRDKDGYACEALR
jgi:micrococcal nuclease